jgi:23S rRNA pseudouridine1911/1915/1917 synthase
VVQPSIIEQCFVVENECHGWRLDRFLQKRIRRMSRNRIQRVIEGDCDVDGRVARSGMRVFSGQRVSFRRPAPPEPEVPREFRVVCSDPSFYVIDKPAGLPIHPTGRYHFSTLTAVMRERFPGEPLQVAHRLDRETSGLLLVARTARAASVLKSAFQKRLIRKRYLAIAHGHLDSDQAVLEQPIGPAGSLVRVRMAVRSLAEGGLPSRTDVQVLERSRRFSLLECRPFTGRQHQIRVHLDAIGHPIVGDKLYPDETVFLRWIARGGGIEDAEEESDTEPEDRAAAAVPSGQGRTADADRDPDEADRWELGDEADGESAPTALRTAEEALGLELPRHALHAAGLVFPHPITGEPVTVESALPADLADFFSRDR